MRTTIDSKLHLSVPASKHGSAKNAAETRSTSFDEVFNAAKPKQAEKVEKPEEKRATEAKKTSAPSKKSATQKKRADETGSADENAETSKATAVDDAEKLKLEDAADESDVAVDAEDDVDAAKKEESSADTQNADSVKISDMAAAAAAQSATVQDHPEITGEVSEASEDGEISQVLPNATNPAVKSSASAGNPETAEGAASETESADGSVTAVQTRKPGDSESESSADSNEPDKQDVTKAVEQKSAASAANGQLTAADAESARGLADAAQNSTPQVQPHATTTAPKMAEVQTPQNHANVAPDVRFAEDNHPQIVSSIRGQLLPDGGKMTLKLDPPELGALQVQLHLQDGVMTATFQTSNDDATRMLSHSLSSLKSSLESQGINVERLQVQQAPKDQQAGTNQDARDQSQPNWDNQSARQEQQRKEMLQRMWRKLSGAQDPLDMVA